MSRKFPHHRQLNERDCGAVCLRMIAQYYGRFYTTEQLKSLAQQTPEGTTLLNISEAAEQIGMHTVGARLTYNRLIDDIPLPGIVHWKEVHFIVVIEANEHTVTIADPDAEGIVKIEKSTFLKNWVGDPAAHDREGVILLMEPTADFYSQEVKKTDRSSPGFVWERFMQYRKLSFFLAAAIFAGALLAVTFPFILQTMVDESVEHQNTNLLTMILVAWIVLFFSQLGLDFVRRFILFHVGAKVNIHLVTSFMKKILALPVSFFQSRRTDDVMQTLYDNPRVQRFFTKDAISLAYSSFLLFLFSLVFLAFSWKIFLVFILVSFLQAGLIWYFLGKRKDLNFHRHELAAYHYSKLTDLIRGIKDIKMANAERNQRWVWERSEAKLYQVSKSYALSDELSIQLPFFLGEFRNILVIFLAAQAVIEGSMTIGVLVAIVFILTQLNNPLKQMIEFFLGWQETRHSLERMDEVNNFNAELAGGKLDILPESGMLEGENVSFRYEGGQGLWVFRNFDFHVPLNRTTIITGASGSGKTTLLNLMLNFLQPQEGIIKFGGVKLGDIEHATWLAKCGVVPQDGHLFYATIAQNIALGDEVINSQRLLESAKIANILPLLERLPNGFNTVIGEGGTGLSKGQRQGILIARAVYQNPDFLFLDEATNDLDPESEKIVLKRISQAFRGKTLVIVNSRMNLPIPMDNIIPLSPAGTHREDSGELANLWGGNGKGLTDRMDGVFTSN
jgi:ATP-binding cassette, subfamily B, bacterial